MAHAHRSSSVTLHDVAREAGVSLATASRTLNGSERTVKEANRQLVLEAAARLGYSPNASAQAVARGTTTTVALIVGDIADPYFSSIAAGVVEAAERHGLVVTMTATQRDSAREVEVVRALRGQRPRAIILAASRRTADPHRAELGRELAAFEAGGGRVVLLGGESLPFPSVSIANGDGGKQLGARLAARGYRRAAVLAGVATPGATGGLQTSDERVEGFLEAFATAGAPIPETRIVPTAFTRDGGYDAMRGLIEAGLDGLELVFAANDVMAVGAMSALRDAGLTPGVDLAVAGFDDIPTLRDVTPRLTTVRLPLEQVGARAVELALDGEASSQGPIVGEVLLRESTPER